jgi:AcrR family transcriptional regulator
MIVSMSDERTTRILDAAYVCFVRHGVRRTTMEDIAQEAGMSRPAVYQYLRGKDEVFQRLGARICSEALAQARAESGGEGTLTQRLDRTLATRLDLPQRLARDTPHAADLWTPSLDRAFTAALVEIVVRMIVDATVEVGVALSEEHAREVAELLVALVRGLEAEPVRARERLRNGVALLVAGLAAATRPGRST